MENNLALIVWVGVMRNHNAITAKTLHEDVFHLLLCTSDLGTKKGGDCIAVKKAVSLTQVLYEGYFYLKGYKVSKKAESISQKRRSQHSGCFSTCFLLESR